MSMNNRKIAGFMSAESIFSLAFYVLMVAAIAGVGASVLMKKDSTKAAAAISLIRANFVADTATLGYPPAADIDEAFVQRMSGNLLDVVGGDAVLPGGGIVTISLRSATFPSTGFSINVAGIDKPEICNAIGGVGWGTWSAFSAIPGSTPVASNIILVNLSSKADVRAICDAATAASATLQFASY